MTQHANRAWQNKRTVIVGAGPSGEAIVAAFLRRQSRRPAGLKHIAALMVALPAEKVREPDAHAPVVALAGDTATRAVARQALHTAGPDLVQALTAELMRITRFQPAATFHANPGRSHDGNEVAIFLVAALDEPLGSVALRDLAYLARQLIHQRLNATAQISGLGLLPDALALADPRPAMACAYAGLLEIGAMLLPHDGPVIDWGDGLLVESWGPAFDRGFYLLGALNGRGWGLPGQGEREELAAEALIQLAAGPLGESCEPPALLALPSGQGGGRQQEPVQEAACSSLGVAAWVYPAEELAEALAQRLAGEIIAAWLEPAGAAGPGTGPEEAASWLAEQGGNADDLARTLLAGSPADDANLWRPATTELSPWRPREYRSDLQAEMGRRLERLAAGRAELDRRAASLGEQLSQALLLAGQTRLDRAEPGRIAAVERFVQAVSQQIQGLQEERAERTESHWQALQVLESELAAAAARLDGLAGHALAPEGTWRAGLKTLFQIGRWPGLVQAMVELRGQGTTYSALLVRQIALALDVLRGDLVQAVYEAALSGMERTAQRLVELRVSLEGAGEQFQPGNAGLFGSLGFSLEQSILTEEMAQALYGRVRGAIADRLSELASSPESLSTWLRLRADGEDLAGIVLDFSRARCQSVRNQAIDDLLVQALPTPGERNEALQQLAAAASPFLSYDETRLQNLESQVVYECIALAAAQGEHSPLLAGLGDLMWAQVAASGDRQRVTALAAIHGLPLSALAGIEEYRLAFYEAEDMT